MILVSTESPGRRRLMILCRELRAQRKSEIRQINCRNPTKASTMSLLAEQPKAAKREPRVRKSAVDFDFERDKCVFQIQI